MSVVLERGDPRAHREEAIALFEDNETGPFGDIFDWYYCEGVQKPPTSWILLARSSRRLVGMCSILHRTLVFGDRVVRAGILGNLIVDPKDRSTLGGVELLRAARRPATTAQ